VKIVLVFIGNRLYFARMETQLTHAEANTAQDVRIAELLETISTLKATLEECLDGDVGFVHNGIFIENPFISECGRFDVDPLKHYGLTLKKIIEIFGKDYERLLS